MPHAYTRLPLALNRCFRYVLVSAWHIDAGSLRFSDIRADGSLVRVWKADGLVVELRPALSTKKISALDVL